MAQEGSRTPPSASAVDDLFRSGYALLPAVLSPDRVDALRTALDSLLRAERGSGCAWREPPAGQRVWMLLNKGAIFLDLILQPFVIATADTLVGAPVLLSNATANVVGPGAAPQGLHTDQGYLPESVHVPMVLTAIWLLDDFTEENGATLMIPGSHLGASTASVRAVGRRALCC